MVANTRVETSLSQRRPHMPKIQPIRTMLTEGKRRISLGRAEAQLGLPRG